MLYEVTMRPIYCDESVYIPVTEGLKRRGWQVYTVLDEARGETRIDSNSATHAKTTGSS